MHNGKTSQRRNRKEIWFVCPHMQSYTDLSCGSLVLVSFSLLFYIFFFLSLNAVLSSQKKKIEKIRSSSIKTHKHVLFLDMDLACEYLKSWGMCQNFQRRIDVLNKKKKKIDVYFHHNVISLKKKSIIQLR